MDMWKYKIQSECKQYNGFLLVFICQSIHLLIAIRSYTCCVVLLMGVRLVFQAFSSAGLFAKKLHVAARLLELNLLCKAAHTAVLRHCKEQEHKAYKNQQVNPHHLVLYSASFIGLQAFRLYFSKYIINIV